MAEVGQHKGKEKKNTLILEAIWDPDTYIWYCFLESQDHSMISIFWRSQQLLGLF